jgi:hypothetical protein
VTATRLLYALYQIMPLTFLFEWLLAALLLRWRIARHRAHWTGH